MLERLLSYASFALRVCLQKSGALHVERGVSHAGVTEIEMVLKKQICDFFFPSKFGTNYEGMLSKYAISMGLLSGQSIDDPRS